MRLDDYITDYLNHITHERGLSKKTIKGAQAWLHNLCHWLVENGYPEPSLDAFTTPTLRRYQYHLSGKGYRPRTMLSVFYPIRSFGDFLVANGALTENPARALILPKKDAAKRLTVSDGEIAQLLDACERQRTPRQITQARALICVFVYGGLRRQECLDLRVDDVNFAEGSLLVRMGKGRKSRKVFVPTACLTALREWLAVRPTDTRHDWLWAYDRNRRLHTKGLQTLLEDIKAIAGMKDAENVKPHSLRHACATRLLRNGANIRDIQAWLGHSQMTTTAQYLHSNEEQLRNLAHLAELPGPQKPEEPDNVIRLPHRQEAQQTRRRRLAR